MSPSELDEYLSMRPMPTLRLVLASGDQVIVREEDEPFVSTLALVLRGDKEGKRVTADSRLVSIPNIVLAEVLRERRPGMGRRPRSR